jgi:16S rRNA (adenine1518-N6/adenine1519-N6)-dimethyltransferase
MEGSPIALRKPKLSQHFLSDQHAAAKIVSALGDISQQTVLEIGAGQGALTELLATRAKKLIAIEFDRILATQLRVKYTAKRHVEVIEGDILAVDFDTLVQGSLTGLSGTQSGPGRTARVVGNLPYHITSDILLKLFEFHENFDVLVLMVQREVADRLSAKPGSRDYGLLTATANLFADVENLFTLPPGAFSPPPKVHSSVLRLRIAPKSRGLGIDADQFVRFLKVSFAHKRKTLVNNLRAGYGDAIARKALVRVGVKPEIRAEAVSMEKMAEIFKELKMSFES